MVAAGVTAKLAPLAEFPILMPPDGTVYQLIILPAEIAFKLAGPPTPQKALGVAVTLIGGGVEFTVIVTDEVEVQLFASLAITV